MAGAKWGVFRSIDGGASWTAANVGLPVSAVVNIIQSVVVLFLRPRFRALSVNG
jgi:hypothetical protein